MAGSGAEKYGNLYWCIKTDVSLKTGEVYAFADKVQIDQAGCLVLLRCRDGEELPTLAFAPGSWQTFYAASVMDGSAVSVEHWDGEATG